MTGSVTAKWIGMKELSVKFKQLSEAAAGESLKTAVQAGGLVIRNSAAERAPKKTRTLARSIHMEIQEASRERCIVAIGTDLEYAAMQEFGGTVTPKTAKFLAIPLTDAARAAVSPRNFPGELEPRIRGGSGVLLDEAGVPQYALTKSATIPAHPYLRPALDEDGQQAVEEMGRVLKVKIESV